MEKSPVKYNHSKTRRSKRRAARSRRACEDGSYSDVYPFIKVKIMGSTKSAFLDMGATSSLMDMAYANELRAAGHKIETHERPLKIARGYTTIKAKTFITVYWKFGSVSQRFYIVEGLAYPIILGRDFQGAAGIDPSVRRKGYTYAPKFDIVIPFDRPDSHDEECLFVSEQNKAWARDQCELTTCPPESRDALQGVMEEYSSKGLFSKKPGFVEWVQHDVDTGDAEPYRCRPRPLNNKKRAVLDGCLDQLLDEETIQPGRSR